MRRKWRQTSRIKQFRVDEEEREEKKEQKKSREEERGRAVEVVADKTREAVKKGLAITNIKF